MLTAKKRAFIDFYKLHRNATEAAKLAGYSPKTAGSTGHYLLKDNDISSAIASWEAEERQKVAEAVPTKQSYLVQTFIKSKEVAHAPTAAKYWEIGGKVAGYIGEEKQDESATLNVLINELHLSLSSMPQILNDAHQIYVDDKSNSPLPASANIINVSETPSTTTEESQEKFST